MFLGHGVRGGGCFARITDDLQRELCFLWDWNAWDSNRQGHECNRDEDHEDPSNSRQPEARGGSLKTGGKQSGVCLLFIQMVFDSAMGAAKEIAGKDPHEELLKYKQWKSFTSKA